jgi:hypothetical protein
VTLNIGGDAANGKPLFEGILRAPDLGRSGLSQRKRDGVGCGSHPVQSGLTIGDCGIVVGTQRTFLV